MNNIESDLKKLNEQTFKPFFHTRVMARLEQSSGIVSELFAWKLLIPAFGIILLCFSMVYLQDGSLNIDAILGIEEANSITDYLIYY